MRAQIVFFLSLSLALSRCLSYYFHFCTAVAVGRVSSACIARYNNMETAELNLIKRKISRCTHSINKHYMNLQKHNRISVEQLILLFVLTVHKMQFKQFRCIAETTINDSFFTFMGACQCTFFRTFNCNRVPRVARLISFSSMRRHTTFLCQRCPLLFMVILAPCNLSEMPTLQISDWWTTLCIYIVTAQIFPFLFTLMKSLEYIISIIIVKIFCLTTKYARPFKHRGVFFVLQYFYLPPSLSVSRRCFSFSFDAKDNNNNSNNVTVYGNSATNCARSHTEVIM